MSPRLLLAAALAATVLSAQAVDAIYTDPASFAAAVGPVSSQDFEGQAGSLLAYRVIDLGAFSVSSGSRIGLQTAAMAPGDGYGAYGTAGPSFVLVYEIGQAPTVFLNFAAPVTAVALDLTDLGEVIGSLRLSTDTGAYVGGVDALQWALPVGGGQQHFVGLQQTMPFTTLEIHATGLDEAFGMDNIRFVNAVPEPTSALLMLAGGGLLALRRRPLRS